MNCDHLANVEAALSTGTSVFQHLPTVRNFYAHRNEETSRKALAVGVTYVIADKPAPTPMLLTPAIKRPQALMLDWIDDIETVMELLCD
jgi:hypothetical protein